MAGLAIGGLTLIAAFLAAKWAKAAATHTEKGAKAAEEAVAESRRIGEAQTRAYISIVSLSGTRTAGGLIFQASVRNSGQSPALAVSITISVIGDDPDRQSITPKQSMIIPANGTAKLVQCFLKSNDALNWLSAVAICTVTYTDVFSKSGSTRDGFAGSPVTWDFDNFTDMNRGMDVLEFYQVMQPNYYVDGERREDQV